MTNPLRVLQVHNKYRPGWGGEDTVVDLEADLLARNGHSVERLSVWTRELDGASLFRIVGAGFGTVWSVRGYRLMRDALARFSPDIVHVHNVFPLLSPSIYWAAAARGGIPVVQTMHNYRLACANAILLRNERPCTDCVGHFPWAALAHRCHGSSFFRTAAVSSMNVFHRWIGTFRNKIHAYIAMTDFSKELLERAGLPGERVFVKPNFTSDPGRLVGLRYRQFVYAGEISRAKGVHLLLDAWTQLASDEFKLVMVGDGPDRAALEHYTGARNVVWMGAQPRQKVIDQIAMSKWLVLPSLAYENCSMTVLEAFSAGTPVVVPNHGSFRAMVSDRKEGILFLPGDVASLTSTLRAAACACEAEWMVWSGHARGRFCRELTAEANYSQLMRVYQKATEHFSSMSSSALMEEKRNQSRYEPENSRHAAAREGKRLT